jgi:hypothetical protein
MDRRFLGSTVALILGLLFSMTAPGRSREPVPQTLCGVAAVAGALAFRSKKRRRLGLCDDSSGRRVAEGAALVSIVALVVLQSSVLARMYREPRPTLPIPASEQLLAYVIPSGEAPAFEPPMAVRVTALRMC